MRKTLQVREETELARDGSNLANVVGTLPRRTQEALATDLTKLVPVFRDIHVRPASVGHHRVVFQDRWNEDLWYEPNEVSDGTILTLGLLFLQHQKASLITIEEPEHGLHPFLIGELVSLLRRLSSGELGHKTQIVLATHSAELLEHLRPEEVRFMNRDADGAVTVEEAPLDTPDWREVYEAHQESLGSLWLSGAAGGTPGE